ncbi:penicillin-binding transpeptidase domain-containing protein [Spongiactinospora rosea]|nr:penicillin-binding transpeptidase domain-containing protein [Spongiactinospora rosea]
MKRLLVLLTVVLAVLVGAGVFVLYPRLMPVRGTPEEIARAYLAAWRAGDLGAMRVMVADPPADFAARHRRFDAGFRVASLTVTAKTLTRDGEEAARLAFEGTRRIRDLGPWPFSGTLRLAVRDRRWQVLWGPEVLHPALRDGGSLRLTEIKVPSAELLTRSGEAMPKDHAAESYLADLGGRLGPPVTGWAVEAERAGRARRLVTYQPTAKRKVRTTLSRPVQAAAARALDGVREAAAIVAVRPGTGEILAVADRLDPAARGRGERPRRAAFEEASRPGGVFQVVTAAALLSAGMTPQSTVACPRDFTPRGTRRIANPGRAAHGTVSLAKALAMSCDTAFARQAVDRLGGGKLAAQAAALGFGRRLGSGVRGTCGTPPGGAAGGVRGLPYDAIGHGAVRATPLCMALVAAAVRNGTWHPPRLTAARTARALDKVRPKDVPVPRDVLSGLRAMLRAEAAQRRLAKGSAGHMGGTRTDAWFAGYRGDVAFAVLVKNGGPPRASALPIAARFLRAL